jgi:C4-dicarboxylate-specific signal transduction histidine kinase
MRAMFRKAPTPRSPSDVNVLIRQVLVLAAGRIEAAGVHVTTRLADNLPAVLADPVQLQQVFLNLIMNAVDAMGETASGARRLQVTTGGLPDRVSITVEDSGPGLDAATLPRVFDPFFTTKQHGMGMGLPICKSIIEAHGGELTASAGALGGAAFRVVLPVQGAAQP